MSDVDILTWDWKDFPDFDDIDRIVYNRSVTGQAVRILQIDTGSDQVAIAIGDGSLTQEAAQAAYRRRWER